MVKKWFLYPDHQQILYHNHVIYRLFVHRFISVCARVVQLRLTPQLSPALSISPSFPPSLSPGDQCQSVAQCDVELHCATCNLLTYLSPHWSTRVTWSQVIALIGSVWVPPRHLRESTPCYEPHRALPPWYCLGEVEGRRERERPPEGLNPITWYQVPLKTVPSFGCITCVDRVRGKRTLPGPRTRILTTRPPHRL